MAGDGSAPELRRRVSAVAALLAVPIGVGLVTAGVIRGMPGLLLPAALLVAAAFAGWKALVRRGVRRRAYAVLAAALLVAGVVSLVAIGVELLLVGPGVVLLAAGSALAGVALVQFHRPSGRLVGPSRHPVLIVNPRSGDGAAERSGLVDAARARGIRVVELTEGDDLAQLARREVRRGADCLGMAGGDGSMALVARAALAGHVPFVCVPAGTRNHLALDLGLDRSDPVAALDAFGEAFQRRIDVAYVNDRLFLNNVSVGAYGEVVAEEQYRERKVGTALERLPDLVGPESEPLELSFVDGDGETHESAVVLHVSNNAYDLVPTPGFGSRPSLSDGVLGVVAVVQTPDGAAPRVLQWSAERLAVGSSGPLASGIDGEAEPLDPPLRFSLSPGALRVRIPRDISGVSPAARRPSFTRETVRRLVGVASGRVDAESQASRQS